MHCSMWHIESSTQTSSVWVQKDNTLSKLAAMEGAVPKQLQPAFKKVMQRLQQVLAWHTYALTMHALCPPPMFIHFFLLFIHSLSMCPLLESGMHSPEFHFSTDPCMRSCFGSQYTNSSACWCFLPVCHLQKRTEPYRVTLRARHQSPSRLCLRWMPDI